jgi:hypothetical protein
MIDQRRNFDRKTTFAGIYYHPEVICYSYINATNLGSDYRVQSRGFWIYYHLPLPDRRSELNVGSDISNDNRMGEGVNSQTARE